MSLLAFYLDLHQHPELSGAEERTAAAFAARLRAAGCEVHQHVGGHGVVGVLRNGAGPVVLIRAELDGLPIAERTGLPYASAGNAMHACGHDAHLACVAGAVAALARDRDAWRGTLLAVGQPAEETLSGARAMLDDGLYTRWGRPDVALAQHVAPLPAGLVAHSAGPATAGCVNLSVVVHGRGGHAAMPHLSVNPIPVAAAIVTGLDGLGGAGAVVTAGAVHAGGPGNVVPETATLSIGIRGHHEAALRRAHAGLADLADRHATDAGCSSEVTVVSRAPVGHNDPDAAATVRRAHERTFGPAAVIRSPPPMATEDFALYAVPTVYWLTGCIGPRRWAAAGATPAERLTRVPPNHSPRFAPDPIPTLRHGTAAMVAAVLEFTRPLTMEVSR